MSTQDPPADDNLEAASRLAGLGDEELLAALSEMLGQRQAPPRWSVDLARESYGLRAIDAELAALTSDSELETTGSRLRAGSGPRLVAFDAAALSVEIEIEPGSRAGRWRLIGQLIPAGPARILLRRASPAAPAWDAADERGRFAVDDLAGGPLSLLCVRQGEQAVATAWITIG
jgi:hypothetical protein